MSRRFVAVDLETTGVDPKQDYIIEVGLAGEAPDGHYFESEFSLPFPEEAMSEGAAAVNGWGKRLFPRLMENGPAIDYLATMLDDVYIVGKNPSFDEAFLRLFLCGDLRSRWSGYSPKWPWHHRLVDVGCLAWGACNALEMQVIKKDKNPLSHPPNVEQVETMVGSMRSKVGEYHTALLDARWAYGIFRSIVPKEDS